MNEHQYAMLILQLAAVGQRSDVFDQLDNDQLMTLTYMLEQAQQNAAVAMKRRMQTTAAKESL